MKNINSLLHRIPFLNGCLLVLGLLLHQIVIAQAGAPSLAAGSPLGGVTNPPQGAAGTPCFGSLCVPIDTGVIFLIVAGVLLGLRFVYVMRLRQQA